MNERVDKRRWLIVALLFSFMLINFADKAVLGLSAAPIIAELNLTHAQFGQVGSSFFLFFSISAVLVGFLVNRVSSKWTLTGMGLIWAIAQLPMMLMSGLPLLLLNRVVLGAGEGPAFPVALHALYKWFPDERRPLPTSIVSLGGAVGSGIAAPAITYVILTQSWHAAFGVLGFIGLAWVLVWFAVGREGPLTTSAPAGADPRAFRLPYLRLLTCRTVIGTVISGFSAYWLLTLAVVWLPSYLNKGAGYSPTQVGWIVTLPALFQILAIPAISSFSERLKRRGVSSRLSRGAACAGSVLVAGAMIFLLPFARGEVLPILCTAVGFGIGSITFILGPVIVSEVTPVAQRGAVLGINGAVATLAGVFAPAVMGNIVDVGANATEGFRTGFVIAGALVMVGALIGLVLIHPEADARRFARFRERDGTTVPPSPIKALEVFP